jgi:hypothetical protein
MQQELKECPFCGSEAYLCMVGNASTKERGCNVGCNECHFHKQFRVVRYTIEWCESKAIEWWNNRAPNLSAEKVDFGALAVHVASALGAMKGYGFQGVAAVKSLEHVQNVLMCLYQIKPETQPNLSAEQGERGAEKATGAQETGVWRTKPNLSDEGDCMTDFDYWYSKTYYWVWGKDNLPTDQYHYASFKECWNVALSTKQQPNLSALDSDEAVEVVGKAIAEEYWVCAVRWEARKKAKAAIQAVKGILG